MALKDLKEIDNSFSFAETRYLIKEKIRTFIEGSYSSPQAASLLTALMLGELNDRELYQNFSQLGLLHLLAISGFHFSLIAKFLSFLFRFFLPMKWVTTLVLLLLTGYFLLLGACPSVLRAWMTIFLTFSGLLLEKRSLSVNALGFALLASLVVDPLLLYNIGFQFSFVCTLAILILYPVFLKGLVKIYPSRSFEAVLKWPKLDQISYVFLQMMMKNLTLGVSVTLIALPLTLIHFGSFPWLSLLFNLIYPFLLAQSISLFLLGIFALPIPLLAAKIHFFNNFFTDFILNFTHFVPELPFLTLKYNNFDKLFITNLLIMIFLSAIYLQKSENIINLRSE